MTDEDPLLISGYAAYRHAPPPPHVQRRVAARATYEARMTTGAAREPAFRRALELHVDAFLLDRRGNADSFAQAHRIGRELVAEFSCPLAQDEHRHWVNRCGVLALHNRIGASPGGTIVTACSICGAGPFECEHVEGEVYDGQRCLHVVQNFDLAEVSLTPWPRDPRCYRVSRPQTTRQVEQELGRRLAPGEVPHCRHCASCSGCAGPTEDDLDPSHFAELADE